MVEPRGAPSRRRTPPTLPGKTLRRRALHSHLTNGVFDDGRECRRVADELNAQRFAITARVRNLSIASGPGVAEVYREIELSGR